METDRHPATGPVALAEGAEEDFENIYDVPFVTVNRIDGRYVAEVILSGNEGVDQVRIQAALDVGFAYGVHAYARIHSDITYYEDDTKSILIHFTPDSLPDDIEYAWSR